MKGKHRFVKSAALGLLTLLALTMLGQSNIANITKARSAEATQPPATLESVQLGFNPSSLVTVATEIPTFTVGDEMWMMVTFNASANVELFPPSSGNALVNKTIEPDSLTLLFTFNSQATPDGQWKVSFPKSQFGNFTFPVEVVNPANHTIQTSLSSYGFEGGDLALNYTVGAPLDSYGIQGCLLPKSISPTVILDSPASIGGAIEIANQGGTASVVAVGNVSQLFEFWVELYATYSYQSASQLSSYPVESAMTNPVSLSSQSRAANPAIIPLLGMRSGLYEGPYLDSGRIRPAERPMDLAVRVHFRSDEWHHPFPKGYAFEFLKSLALNAFSQLQFRGCVAFLLEVAQSADCGRHFV